MAKKKSSSKKSSAEGESSSSSNNLHMSTTSAATTSSPPPPVDLLDDIPVVPDYDLQVSPSMHARLDNKKKTDKVMKAPTAARISRPGAAARPQMSKRAQSARILPSQMVAPPPPPPAAVPVPPPAAARPGMSNYERAKSLRLLPTAPPPPSAEPLAAPLLAAAPPTTAEAVRPGMSNYERAKSLRMLPTAPPPPSAAPTTAAPAAIPRAALQGRRAASSRNFGSSPAGAMAMQPPPPPPPMDKIGGSMRNLGTPPPPPPSTAPEELILAEGVPLDAGKSALPTMSESQSGGMDTSAKDDPAIVKKGKDKDKDKDKDDKENQKDNKDKKNKKKDEKIAESFEDEYPDDASASEHYEPLSSEEQAEQVEKEVRKSLCIALLTACGMMFMLSLIFKLLSRFSNNQGDEIYDDGGILQGQGGGGGGGPPVAPPPGTSTAVNMGIAQNMAVAASQGAAASSAAGTTAAATAAAAAATAAAATVTTTTVTTVGFVSVAAVSATGAGMATGAIPMPKIFQADKNIHPCHEFLHDMTDRPGRLALHLQGVPENFFSLPNTEDKLQEAFVSAYNDVIGICVAHAVIGHNDTLINSTEAIPSDVYARYMTNATLDTWSYWSLMDTDTGDVTSHYYTTEWTAFVGCDDSDKDGDSYGCSPIEPLFYEGDYTERALAAGVTDGPGASPARRHLLPRELAGEPHNLDLFVTAFNKALQDLVPQQDREGETAVFYSSSLSVNETNRNTVVEEIGRPYTTGQFMFGSGPNGAIDHPYGLPVCNLPNGMPNPNTELKQGYVNVGWIGLDENFVKEQQLLLAQLFREVYNNVMGSCEGDYSRVLQEARLNVTSTREEQGQTLLSTVWSAIVNCDGCADHEPLFAGDGTPSASEKNTGGQSRMLKIEDDSKLAQVVNEFAVKVERQYQRLNPDGTADAFYAATVDEDGVVIDPVGEEHPFPSVPEGLIVCDTGAPPEDTDVLEVGSFELHVKNLVNDINKTILEEAMQNVYNEITGMCEGTYRRVAHEVGITGWNHQVADNSISFVDLNVTTRISCTGCQTAEEPLFFDGDVTEARRFLQAASTFERFRTMLTSEVNRILNEYKDTDYYEEGASLFESSNPNVKYPDVDVVYGVTYDKSGRVVQVVGSPVEQTQPVTSVNEDLAAGDDVIVPLPDCEKALVAADSKPADNGLKDLEYFVFVRSLFGTMESKLTWPQALRSYADLPEEVKEVFNKFQKGGAVYFGRQENGAFTGDNLILVEGLCYHTSHAIRDTIQGETSAPTIPATTAAPTVAATTPAPTQVTTTEAPTVPATTSEPTAAPTMPVTTAAPTLAPTTLAPTGSQAPTETPVVKVKVQFKFTLSPNERAANDEEVAEFVTLASDWMTSEMQKVYESDETYTFESLTSSLLSSDWSEKVTAEKDYHITIILQSDCIFRGDQPTSNEVAEKVTSVFDIATFGNSLFDPPTGFDEKSWVFVSLTEAKIAATNLRLR